jgi:hypothetical protein
MSETPHTSMHHFDSKAAYDSFVEELAITEASAIEKWGTYEVASDIVALVDTQGAEINVGTGSAPDIAGIDEPLCPVTVLEYSEQSSGLPPDEAEHITHVAVELLEQDIQNYINTSQHSAD